MPENLGALFDDRPAQLRNIARSRTVLDAVTVGEREAAPRIRHATADFAQGSTEWTVPGATLAELTGIQPANLTVLQPARELARFTPARYQSSPLTDIAVGGFGHSGVWDRDEPKTPIEDDPADDQPGNEPPPAEDPPPFYGERDCYCERFYVVGSGPAAACELERDEDGSSSSLCKAVLVTGPPTMWDVRPWRITSQDADGRPSGLVALKGDLLGGHMSGVSIDYRNSSPWDLRGTVVCGRTVSVEIRPWPKDYKANYPDAPAPQMEGECTIVGYFNGAECGREKLRIGNPPLPPADDCACTAWCWEWDDFGDEERKLGGNIPCAIRLGEDWQDQSQWPKVIEDGLSVFIAVDLEGGDPGPHRLALRSRLGLLAFGESIDEPPVQFIDRNTACPKKHVFLVYPSDKARRRWLQSSRLEDEVLVAFNGGVCEVIAVAIQRPCDLGEARARAKASHVAEITEFVVSLTNAQPTELIPTRKIVETDAGKVILSLAVDWDLAYIFEPEDCCCIYSKGARVTVKVHVLGSGSTLRAHAEGHVARLNLPETRQKVEQYLKKILKESKINLPECKHRDEPGCSVELERIQARLNGVERRLVWYLTELGKSCHLISDSSSGKCVITASTWLTGNSDPLRFMPGVFTLIPPPALNESEPVQVDIGSKSGKLRFRATPAHPDIPPEGISSVNAGPLGFSGRLRHTVYGNRPVRFECIGAGSFTRDSFREGNFEDRIIVDTASGPQFVCAIDAVIAPSCRIESNEPVGIVNARGMVYYALEGLLPERSKDFDMTTLRLDLGVHPPCCVLIWVHGYNTNEAEAQRAFVEAYTQYKAVASGCCKFIGFAWHGDTPLGLFPEEDGGHKWDLGFEQAEHAANFTADGLAYLISHLRKDYPQTAVIVAAHSLGNRVALQALKRLEGNDSIDYLLSFNAAVRADSFTIGRGEFVGVPQSKVRKRIFVLYDEDDDVLPQYENWTHLYEKEGLGGLNSLGRWGPGPDPWSNQIIAANLAWYPGWRGPALASRYRHSFIYEAEKSRGFFERFFSIFLKDYGGC